jgi:Tol biopolymer transport system component
MGTLGKRGSSTIVASALTLLVLLAVLALAACGGSSTTASPSPSVEPSQAAASPSVASSPSETPLQTPTVAGTIAFSRGGADGARDDIYLVNADGTGLSRLTSGSAPFNEHPSWSPDGGKIVYHSGAGELSTFTIWVMNADGSNNRRLAKGSVNGIFPSWSPDGRHIAFSRWSQKSSDELLTIAIMNADGSQLRNLTGGPGDDRFASWASNGRVLFLRGGDVYAVDVGGGRAVRVTKTGGIDDYALSPDGKLIVVDDARDDRILLVPLRGGGTPVTLVELNHDPVDLGAIVSPTWTQDGKAVVMATSDWELELDEGSSLYQVNADGTSLSIVPGIEYAFDPAWRPE